MYNPGKLNKQYCEIGKNTTEALCIDFLQSFIHIFASRIE